MMRFQSIVRSSTAYRVCHDGGSEGITQRDWLGFLRHPGTQLYLSKATYVKVELKLNAFIYVPEEHKQSHRIELVETKKMIPSTPFCQNIDLRQSGNKATIS